MVRWCRRYGVDPWLLAQAVVWDKKICEVSLGAKIGPPALSKRSYVFKQLALSLFDCIKVNEDYWLKSQLILKQPDIYGLEARDRAPELSCHLGDLVASFTLGFDQYSSLLARVLPEENYAAVEKVALTAETEPEFSSKLWSAVVYSFLQTYVFADGVEAEDIMEGLRIVYDGRLAAFIAGVSKFSYLISEVKHLDKEELTYKQVERLRGDQVAEFLDGKSGFIKTWVERAAEVRPVITPLDYLEFIPGVPLALPKDLTGIGGLPVRAKTVFRRLENA